MKKFLVIQTASIGDVILATPVLEKLHSFYPDAQIDILIKKGTEELFANHPFLHHVFVWNKRKKKYANWWKILKAVRSEKYDEVFCIQRFATVGLFTVLSKAKQTVGFSKNPFSFLFSKKMPHHIGKKGQFYQHEIERNLSLIEHLSDSKPIRPRLYPSSEQYEKVAAFKKQPYICVAPASLWFTKQYPKEKWIEFIREIDEQIVIYYLGGKSDKNLCTNIMSATPKKYSFNLAGELSLLESAALMQDAAMNFVNDSSPTHLASAVNAPTTTIFCSTTPEFGFGPLSDNSKVVEIQENLSCRPCGLHGYRECPEKHFKCAMDIHKEQLLERLRN